MPFGLKGALIGRKKFQKFNYLGFLHIFAPNQNPPSTLKQTKGVQNLHSILCAYDNIAKLEGSKESCLASTTLKITSRMAKRGQVPLRLIMYVHALSAAIILCWTSD
jgi:hypothetical protein